MKFFRSYFTLVLVLFLSSVIRAQSDSLIFKNGNVLVGEIKSMEKGVLIFESDFSDSDFKIEWNGISEIYTKTFFLISLSDGRRFNGYLYTSTPGNVLIQSEEGNPVVALYDLVYLKSVDINFWSRINASLSVGLYIARANHLSQLDTKVNVGYLADRWLTSASFSSLFSTQDSVAATQRQDGSGTFNWFLPRGLFIPASVTYLSNTEQKLDARLTSKLGFGKYVIQTNKSYWGFSAGVTYNNEKYSNESTNRKSWEGYLGTELNFYDIGDFRLLTQGAIYPGLTEKGRFRYDFNIDTKYDLPLDFYIKLGFTVNYDNQPAEGTSETDYVFQTGFGWEW